MDFNVQSAAQDECKFTEQKLKSILTQLFKGTNIRSHWLPLTISNGASGQRMEFLRDQELCESRGARFELPVPNKPGGFCDVNQHELNGGGGGGGGVHS